MNYFQENTSEKSVPWFRHWFDSTYYHKLYAHPDENEAQQFIDELVAHLQPERGASVIDVGCGVAEDSVNILRKKG